MSQRLKTSWEKIRDRMVLDRASCVRIGLLHEDYFLVVLSVRLIPFSALQFLFVYFQSQSLFPVYVLVCQSPAFTLISKSNILSYVLLYLVNLESMTFLTYLEVCHNIKIPNGHVL